ACSPARLSLYATGAPLSSGFRAWHSGCFGALATPHAAGVSDTTETFGHEHPSPLEARLPHVGRSPGSYRPTGASLRSRRNGRWQLAKSLGHAFGARRGRPRYDWNAYRHG